MHRLLAALLLTLLPIGAFAQAPPQPLAFTHVTLIDGTGAKPKRDMTVVITGDHISAVGPSARIKLPEDAQVVDATGKFLIPGLWDMHVHATSIPSFASLYIANGVTGVRDMFTQLPSLLALRKNIKAGKAVGPRIVASGQIVDGPKPVWTGSIEAKTPEEGSKAVATVKQAGSDFVKVYSKLPREVYFAIVDEAKKQSIPFAGHVPNTVSAAEASDAGQRSIEHLTRVLGACAPDSDAQEKALRDALAPELDTAQPDAAKERERLMREHNHKMLTAYDKKTAAALFAKFKQNQTYHCPTLTVLRNIALLGDPAITNDPRVKYLPGYATSTWDPKNDFRFKTWTPEDFDLSKQAYRKQVAVVGAMRKAGVEILAGTDVMNPYCLPGFSLHDELALLVEAGLTPMEALQAATRAPARFFGKEQEMGTVQQGKLADLILLDADPLDNIRNTTKIHAVIANGRHFDRTALDKMLADAEKAAGRRTAHADEAALLHAGFCPDH